jgi:hypothetical protein
MVGSEGRTLTGGPFTELNARCTVLLHVAEITAKSCARLPGGEKVFSDDCATDIRLDNGRVALSTGATHMLMLNRSTPNTTFVL